MFINGPPRFRGILKTIGNPVKRVDGQESNDFRIRLITCSGGRDS